MSNPTSPYFEFVEARMAGMIICVSVLSITPAPSVPEYFRDLELIRGAEAPLCSTTIDCRFGGTFALQLVWAGSIYFQRDDEPRRVIEAPAVFWHHPDHHYRYGPWNGPTWHHHWIMMRGARARRLVEGGFERLSPTGYLPVVSATEVRAAFLAVIEAIPHRVPARESMAVSELERLLAVLIRDVHGQSAATTAATRAVEAAMAAMRQAPTERHDFASLVSRHGVSPTHFRRRFREITGLPPHRWLLRHRMDHAKGLLLAGATVSEVAYACGYDDPAQFSKLFKLRNGCSPRTFYALRGRSAQSSPR